MKKNILLMWFVLMASYVGAQQIQTDRPDQTESYFTVPKNYFQIETGYMFEKFSSEDLKRNTYNTTLLRYGLLKSMELRFNIAYIDEDGIDGNNYSESGIGNMEVGIKYHVMDQDGAVPALSILFHVVLPAGEEALSPEHSEPVFKALGGWELNEKSNLSYNVGMTWPSNSEKEQWTYSVAYGHSIVHQIGAFVEFYGYGNSDDSQNMFDMGFTYLLNDHLQFDVSAGANLKGFGKGYFLSGGVSYLFPLEKNKRMEMKK